jgi:hypothetical protein
MTDTAMSPILWRIVNPGLTPPQVAFECSSDEQAALREYATRNGHAQGFLLHKSEDDGKSWVSVPVRAPDVAVPIAAQQAAASQAASSPQVAPSVTVSGGGSRLDVETEHGDRGSTKHRK